MINNKLCNGIKSNPQTNVCKSLHPFNWKGGGLFNIGIVMQLLGVAGSSFPVSATKINNEIFWSSNWRSRPCLATEPTSDDVVWGTRYSSTMGPRPLRAVGPPRGVTPAAQGRRRDYSVCLTVVMGTGTDS